MGGVLQAILWDVDGTLAETELEGHRRAFNAAFAEHGLAWHWDPDTYRRLLTVGGGRERIAAWMEQLADSGDPGSFAWRDGLLDRLVASKKHHYSELLQQGQVPLRPGVARLITAAAAAGLPQLIVTTSSRAAVQALIQSSLGDLAGAFSGWICGDDVARKKPDPEGYRLALTRLGLAGSAVLAVEDSPQGLAAAVAAGLPTLVTLSELTRSEPLQTFEAAVAVVDGLGSAQQPLTLLRGPACPEGVATLSWLEQLLPSP
jgi:HAD superfamily hydrolase (TIGR01509 family)